MCVCGIVKLRVRWERDGRGGEGLTQQTAWQCCSVLQLQAREGCTCKRDKLFSYSRGQAKWNGGGRGDVQLLSEVVTGWTRGVGGKGALLETTR